jgi:hypothetical protein
VAFGALVNVGLLLGFLVVLDFTLTLSRVCFGYVDSLISDSITSLNFAFILLESFIYLNLKSLTHGSHEVDLVS